MDVLSCAAHERKLNDMDDLRVVFESRNRRACRDRALVLEAAQIPYQIVDEAEFSVLVVPVEWSPRAARELRLYDEENPPPQGKRVLDQEPRNALPGVIGYVLIISSVGWLAGHSAFGEDWLAAGRIDGSLLRAGQWWRTITALTLHSGLEHLVGNLIFGVFFGLYAGRLLGPGIAWLTILLAGASGNALNTLLLESTHRSIGASTAVFAALGLLAGFVWRGKLMSQTRWPLRIGPIVGGLALLMYTGTGDANTDVGAHLMGFLCGFGAGAILGPVRQRMNNRKLQLMSAALAPAIVFCAWLAAFFA